MDVLNFVLLDSASDKWLVSEHVAAVALGLHPLHTAACWVTFHKTGLLLLV